MRVSGSKFLARRRSGVERFPRGLDRGRSQRGGAGYLRVTLRSGRSAGCLLRQWERDNVTRQALRFHQGQVRRQRDDRFGIKPQVEAMFEERAFYVVPALALCILRLKKR